MSFIHNGSRDDMVTLFRLSLLQYTSSSVCFPDRPDLKLVSNPTGVWRGILGESSMFVVRQVS